MNVLTEGPLVRYSEIRNAIGVAAPTFVEVLKKAGIQGEGARTGTAKFLSPPQVRTILESRGYSFDRHPKVISFMMCKGGVGKTTSSFFSAQRLASYGARVLIIDTDPQGNLTSSFHLEKYGMEVDEGTPILVDIISGRCELDEAIIAFTPYLHLIPSTPLNSTLEGHLRDEGFSHNPTETLRQALYPLLDRYDYVIIDCAPTLNLVNASVICASDLVILPVTLDKFSQIGLEQTLVEIASIESEFSVQVDKKIVFTKFDHKEVLSFRYLSDILSRHRERLFNTAIRISTDVKAAISNDENLFESKKSHAREDYDEFTRELMGLKMIHPKGSRKGGGIHLHG